MQGRIKKKKRALSEASEKTRTEFSKIVETAADLPLAPKNKRKKASLETLPTSVTPMAETSSASAGQASLLSSPGLVMPGDDMLSAFYSIMMAEALIETNLTFDAPFSSNPTGVSDDHPSSLTTSATAAIIIDPVISNPMAPAIALDKAPSATSSVSAAILPPASPSVPTAPLGTSLNLNPTDASDVSASRVADPSEQTPAQRSQKRLEQNEGARNTRAEGRRKRSKLFNIYTGKPAPEGAPPSEQYITFRAYLHRHAENTNITKTTYVNAETGELADGITKETYLPGQHTTLYNWRVHQYHEEFSKILKEGGDLPPLTTLRSAIDLINTAKQPPLLAGTTEQKQTLELSFLDSETPSTSPDKIPSAASSVSALILPPASHPLPTPLNTPSSSNSAGASDVSASRAADPSKQRPAQRNQKKLERNERVRKARAEGRWKESKLFNIYTGKPAPEGASPSEQNITFRAYVFRHVPRNKRTKTTYVNDKTGELADGITQETHQRGQHATLYNWLVRQKNKEFSKILAEGGDLPPLKTSRPAIDLINTAKQPPLLAGTTEQKRTLELSFLDSETPSTSPDKIPSAASSVSALILPPASHPLPTPLNTPSSSNPAGASDVSASHAADPSEPTPAQRNQKKLERNERVRKARAEGREKLNKLFNIYTGKPAPEGASPSEQYITFNAYMRRHVESTNLANTTYVNAKTGVPAPGITKETHQRGQHTTLYSWRVCRKYAEFVSIIKKGGALPPALPKKYIRQTAQAADEQKADLTPPTLSTFAPPIGEASSTSGDPLMTSGQAALKMIERRVKSKEPSITSKRYDIYTGKPAPEGASPSEQNITFNAYVRRHIEATKLAKTTYVNTKTGLPADGVTKETRQRGQHTTLYIWQVCKKYTEFVNIIKKGGALPPALPKKYIRQTAQAADEQKADLTPPTLSTFAPPIGEASSTSGDPHSPLMASGQAALKRIERRVKSKEPSITSKRYDIYTGKPAPEGASPSEKNITFHAYVRRHIEATKLTKTTYVNTKTGMPADGITKETHQRGQHTTLHSWLTCEKYAEFVNIIKKGGTLPPALPRKKHKRQKAQAACEQKTHRPSARSNVVLPRAEAASASAGRHSSLTASGHAAVTIIETAKPQPLPDGLTAADLALNRSFLIPATPSTSPDTTPSSVTSVSTPILPPASHPLTSPLDMSLNLNPDEAFDASAHSILSPMISSTDQASPLPSPDLEEFLDDILLAESPFAAESDASVLASLTESDLTAKTATTTGEPLPLLSENPIQKQVARDLDLYFSEPATTRPAFSALPTTPLYAYSAEAADAVIRPGLDPEISAEQDSFAQDTSRKRKPNVHSFFQPKENDHAGHASRKAKKTPSDGSMEHPLPEADTSDSISEALFIPSLAAKKPAF